jgi:predicted acetyltransferase
MQTDVREAAREDEPILQNLLQLYVYDFSEMDGCDVEPDGRYAPYRLAHYWTESMHRAFLVRVDGNLAGLALVEDAASLADGQPTMDVAEFFVMRKYRRKGVGEHVAHHLFGLSAGRWQVRQIAANTGAQAFWRDVIGRYTGGRFIEQPFDDERWRGPAQFFDSSVGAGRDDEVRVGP